MDKPVEICPFCGVGQVATSYGLDVHGDELEWLPCCEDVRELVAMQGWADVWGEPLVATLKRELALDVIEVTDEWRVVMRPRC